MDVVIGFVGLGSMGGPMAARLIAADVNVVAYDVSAENLERACAGGARRVGSVREVAAQADIVLLSLPKPEIVADVVSGAGGLSAGGRVSLVIDLSTTGPRVSRAAGEALRAVGIEFVDAPVSGGRAGAIEGRLAVMASCSDAAWARAEPVLAHFGKVFRVGAEPGQAQTLKLVNNLLSVVALAASSEGLALGVKAGLDPAVMLDVINASSGRNSATTDKLPRAVLTRRFDFGFATGLSLKDVRLALDEAEAMGVPMPVCALARTMLSVTQAKFGAASDFTSIARVVEDWAGVEIKGREQSGP